MNSIHNAIKPQVWRESQEEQVRALPESLQEEGEALLIGKGGKPAMKLPDAVYELLLKTSVSWKVDRQSPSFQCRKT